MTAKYGWRKGLPDHRDLIFQPTAQLLPSSIDLRAQCPAIYDQGQLGSCTANAIGAAFEFELIRQTIKDFTPSRLFLYYNERALEGTVKSDAGAQIRNGIKVAIKQGLCPETEWPYNISQFAKKPTKKCYIDALLNVVNQYQSITQDLNHLKSCLAQQLPFVFGFTVYDSFESATVAASGILNMPGKTEKPIGGHAVMCVGYDDSLQRFIIRNSWGPVWGQKGYFTMPYAYMTSNLCSDFWTIQNVT